MISQIGMVMASAALFLSAASASAADTYAVDTVHSSVVFRVKHMNVAHFYGRFNEFSGKITLDDADPSATAVEMEVKVASIDTANEKRDQHLRSPDYFNAAEHPLIAFKSKSARAVDGGIEVTGDMTMHGQTREVKARIEITGKGKGRGGSSLVGVASTFTVKRSDFGMKVDENALSDEVTLMLGLECVKK